MAPSMALGGFPWRKLSVAISRHGPASGLKWPMAASATLYHLEIELSDVDRGVYQTLDLRVARHPSETMAYLLTRVIAFCLCHEEGLAFSKGLSTTDEPAAWVRDPHGRVTLWIDIGAPTPERLHKASKASGR